jgi:hypothetical protein
MIPKYFRLFTLIVLFCSCSGPSEKNDTTEKTSAKDVTDTFSYDLAHPQRKWLLPDELKEISGQTWLDSNHLLAIEDLHPVLYLLRLDTNAIVEKKSAFLEVTDKKFDMEDIASADNIVYALWSHGTVYKIAGWQSKPEVQEYPTFLSKENNTEGLCYDPVSGNLLIACKNESDLQDEKKSTRSIFEFDLKTGKLKDVPFLVIHKKDFKKIADEKLEFFPSAIAVHPISHDIYLLSTRDNKCMAQYSYNGELKSLQFFDKELLPQPEGICFAPNGTLYISSEGRHGEQPAIFEFRNSK